MTEEPPSAKLKIALVGKEKHGKSWLAATGRDPVLFHDFDNRAEALQGKSGVYVISYVDPQWPTQPDAAQLFLDVLSQLEQSLDLHDLQIWLQKSKGAKLFSQNIPIGTFVRTNVIDSVQTMGKAFSNYALFNSPGIRREITIGKMKVFLGNGWDAWNAEMTPVENNILRMMALPSDTIITLHETMEETEDSTSEKPRYTGKIGVYPVRYQRLLKYINDLWRVKLTMVPDGNKQVFLPRVYPLPTYEFDAATTLSTESVELPSIKNMIAKHEAKLGQKSSAAIAAKQPALPQSK